VTSDNHPDGHAGWVVQPNAKNGDWRRFAISASMSEMIREHIEEHQLGDREPGRHLRATGARRGMNATAALSLDSPGFSISPTN
jgi:hypothetical protein